MARDTQEAPRRRAALSREARVELVLDTAERLFYARGVRSVGMDELVSATGLGKATVYRLFATKDELVAAYLVRLEQRVLALVDDDLSGEARPREGLLAFLTAIEESVGRAGFRGCPFHNASIEYAEPDHPVRLVASRYRQELRERLRAGAVRLTGDRVRGRELGDRLALLVDGAYVSAAHLGADGPARQGLDLARELVRAATPPSE